MVSEEKSLKDLAHRLRETGAGASFLALGQTAFWDEPVKATWVRALSQWFPEAEFVAGVHDTDYFAKLPGHPAAAGDEPYACVPHDDASTRGLWSAAGEMHVLFGAEAVPTRTMLENRGGASLQRAASTIPDPDQWLSETTAAWGWSGLIRTGWRREVVADVVLAKILPVLRRQWQDTVASSALCLSSGDREALRERIDHEMVSFADRNPAAVLPDLYEHLLSFFHGLLTPGLPAIRTTRTTQLLRFNTTTCTLPRFALAGAFLDTETRARACRAYDRAVEGSDIYSLDRFGEGAVPFDVHVPGKGRGTLRLLSDRFVIEAPQPLEVPGRVQSLNDLAIRLESAFGPDCVLLGKAVSLLPMLGAEFHFVFHEGASGYSHRCATLVRNLEAAGIGLPTMHPILRLRLLTWDSLAAVPQVTFCLPRPLRQALGRAQISADDWADCWRRGISWEEARLREWSSLRSPRAMLDHLASSVGGDWISRRQRHAECTNLLMEHRAAASVHVHRIAKARDTVRESRRRIDRIEWEKGEDFRARGGVLDTSAVADRQRRFNEPLSELHREVAARLEAIRDAKREKQAIERSVEVVEARRELREIEAAAERERVAQVADALRVVEGLPLAGRRPSAWWFPLVDPKGAWFDRVAQTQTGWLEPLAAEA